MLIYSKIAEMKKYLSEQKAIGKKIGFVPTMGYLHEGHLALIKDAKEENDIVVVSIFVNPTQFGKGEDFESYPRDLNKDAALSEKAGADAIFAPEVSEMYPIGYQTFVEVEEITENLCGASRPGHFRGVTTVVTKLFNIITPDNAYFGQKDAQQTVVIKRMVKDLNMNVNVKVCSIVRESDGLAMSSRNVYLNKEERKQALVLNQSLILAKELIEKGERDVTKIVNQMTELINDQPLAKIDYVSIVDSESLKELNITSGKILIAIAVKVGTTRLIDNIMMEV